jgi:hypothetical protein
MRLYHSVQSIDIEMCCGEGLGQSWAASTNPPPRLLRRVPGSGGWYYYRWWIRRIGACNPVAVETYPERFLMFVYCFPIPKEVPPPHPTTPLTHPQ